MTGVLVRGIGVALLAVGALKVVGLLGPTPGADRAFLPDEALVAIAAFEALLGIALLLRPGDVRGQLLAAAFLVAATGVALALSLAGVPLARCGCFGPFSDALSSVHLAVNGMLLTAVAAVLLVRPARPRLT